MIALTGSTGFIGRAIANHLPFPQKRLVRTLPLDRKEQVIFVEGDFKETHKLDPFLSEAKVLIHLAWKGSPKTPLSHADMEGNLIPTFHLFRRYSELNPDGHIVFASSGGNIYGKSPKGEAFTEEDLPSPLSPYSYLKLAAEGFLPLLASEYGVGATVMRISNPYGTLLSSSRGQGLIGIAFSKLLEGAPLELFDTLSAVRDYLHISDLARAFQVIVSCPPRRGESRTYNVSSSVGHSTQEVLKLIQDIAEQPLQVKEAGDGIAPCWSPDRSVLSYRKIERALGWSPKASLQEGLKAMWNEVGCTV